MKSKAKKIAARLKKKATVDEGTTKQSETLGVDETKRKTEQAKEGAANMRDMSNKLTSLNSWWDKDATPKQRKHWGKFNELGNENLTALLDMGNTSNGAVSQHARTTTAEIFGREEEAGRPGGPARKGNEHLDTADVQKEAFLGTPETMLMRERAARAGSRDARRARRGPPQQCTPELAKKREIAEKAARCSQSSKPCVHTGPARLVLSVVPQNCNNTETAARPDQGSKGKMLLTPRIMEVMRLCQAKKAAEENPKLTFLGTPKTMAERELRREESTMRKLTKDGRK